MTGFSEQISMELVDLGLSSPTPEVVGGGAAGEPYVRSVHQTLVGLALSGGGIRSATFSLGFLKGLADLDLLRLFQYLSTVSGGGYIGGWWSAYLARKGAAEDHPPQREDRRFPYPDRGEPESKALRHLREFSRFLAPRLGFFELETGELILAYIGVLVPSLALATVVILGAVWSFQLWLDRLEAGWMSAAYTGAATTLAGLLVCEWRWRCRKKCDPAECGSWFPIGVLTLLASGAVGTTAFFLLASPATRPTGRDLDFFTPLPWLLTTAVLLLFVRPLTAAWRRSDPVQRSAIDLAVERTQIRVLSMSVLVLCAVLVCSAGWHLEDAALEWVAGLAGLGNVSFALAIKWLADHARTLGPAGKPLAGTPILKRWFAEHGVRAMAIGVCLALFVLGAAVVDRLGPGPSLITILFSFLIGFLLNPTEGGGLHRFYASRLARAYLADSARTVDRYTQPSSRDDMLMKDAQPRGGPVHLVCCAVNDLSGDPLATLNRGARSAVYSPHGFGFGNAFAPWDPASCPSLGSALGASGAALNSNMGSLSKELGPAVTFLACALNLRLGAWLALVRNQGILAGPRWSASSSLASVEAFFREMFGMTRADDGSELVHVSDGGHFENLGLYELIRRHCRYVVVVDAGMDSELAFEDLGNALRRIRQDFGVEVDVALEPLRQLEGMSSQHAVVGDLRYPDGHHGVLVYVKPTLTGDEPADVLHYRSSHRLFPHESTVDQFFDDEQWEAYRRLGEHTAHSIFDFVAQWDGNEERASAAIFAEARWRWYPATSDLRSNFLELTSGFDDAESLLWHASERLVEDVYPEAGAAKRAANVSAGGEGSRNLPEDLRETLPVLIQVTQLMEDVWFAANLDRNGNHPMAQGWLNYFRRWAHAPQYRAWWPLLSASFSLGFRRFMELRFDLPTAADQKLDLHTTWPDSVNDALLISEWPRRRMAMERKEAVLGRLRLDSSAYELCVAALRFTVESGVAEWGSHDLVVLPSVRWAGFGSAFMRQLQSDRPGPLGGVQLFRVVFARRQSSSLYERQDHSDRLQFYAAAGFREAGGTEDSVILEWSPPSAQEVQPLSPPPVPQPPHATAGVSGRTWFGKAKWRLGRRSLPTPLGD